MAFESMDSNKRRRIGSETATAIETAATDMATVTAMTAIVATVPAVEEKSELKLTPSNLELLPTELLTEVCDLFTVLDYFYYTRTSRQLSKIPGCIPCVEVGAKTTASHNPRTKYAMNLLPRRLTISATALAEYFSNFLKMDTLERFHLTYCGYKMNELIPLFGTTATSTCPNLSSSLDSADSKVQRQLFPRLSEQIFETCPGSSMLFDLAELSSSSPTLLKIGQDDLSGHCKFGCPIHINTQDRMWMEADQLKQFEEREQKWLRKMHTLTKLSLGGSDFFPSWDYPSVTNFPNLTAIELEIATLSENNRDTFEQLQHLAKLAHLSLKLIANTTLDPQLESKFDPESGERSPQMPHADGKFLDALTKMKTLRSLKLHLMFDLEDLETEAGGGIDPLIDHPLTIRTVMSKVYAAKQLTSLELVADDLTVDFFPQALVLVPVAATVVDCDEGKQASAVSHIQQLRLCQLTKQVTMHQGIATTLEQFTRLTSLSIFGLAAVPSSDKLLKLTDLNLAGQLENGVDKSYKNRSNSVCDRRSLKWISDFSKTLTKVTLPFVMGMLYQEYAAAFCAMSAIKEIVLPLLHGGVSSSLWQEFIKRVRAMHPDIVISHYFIDSSRK